MLECLICSRSYRSTPERTAAMNTTFFHLFALPVTSLSKFLFMVGLSTLLYLSLNVQAGPEGRTRTFCGVVKQDCGGHKEVGCSSGSACDADHTSYSGSPFPKTINCPWPLKDIKVDSGCYEYIPNCGDCSAEGQIACPTKAEPYCEAGCDEGLFPEAYTTICRKDGDPGGPCGPTFPCPDGFNCNANFQCTAKAGAGKSCANPFVKCADGLVCTAGLECAHSPSRENEFCDSINTCGEGLFCQGYSSGFALTLGRCKARRKIGESCALQAGIAECMEGASCEICLTENCNAPTQCFPDHSSGGLTTQQCKAMRGSYVHNWARDVGGTLTFGLGEEAAAFGGASLEVGIAYGEDKNDYGCYTTLCYGLVADIGVEAFAAVGLYESFDSVNGESFANVQEAQLPGNLVNFATSQIYPIDPVSGVPVGRLIGTADAFSIGIGPNLLPFAASSVYCETTLDVIQFSDDEETIDLPAPDIVTVDGYGALSFDGENDKLRISDSSFLTALTMTDALTLSLWIKPHIADQTVSLVNKEGEYQIGLVNGELAFSFANESPGWVWDLSGHYPALGQWTHLSVVYENLGATATATLYVDGRQEKVTTSLGAIGDYHPNHNEFHIGGRQFYSEVFNGLIDSVYVWSRALREEEIVSQLGQVPVQTSDDFVAGWEFQEESGDTLVDSSGNAIHLSLNSASNAPLRVADNRFQPGNALHFDGSDDHVSISAESLLDRLQVSSELTLEAWVYPTGEGSGDFGGAIINKEGEYAIGRARNGNVNFALANTTPGWVTSETGVQLEEGRWSHVALTYNSTNEEINIYLNGQLSEARSGTGYIADFHLEQYELQFGGRQLDGVRSIDQRFEGAIDEVRIWEVALTEQELSSLYERSVDTSAEGLIGYWKFDEANTLVALDSSPTGAHGVLGSAKAWKTPRRIDAKSLYGYPLSMLQTCESKYAKDSDGDGVCDAEDNCPLISNATQADSNANSIGDACELMVIVDADGDGVESDADLCAGTTDYATVDSDGCSDSQRDTNWDGITDVIALQIGLNPSIPSGDSDGDGVVDRVEVGVDQSAPKDSDQDSVYDALESGDAALDGAFAAGINLSSSGLMSIRVPDGQQLSNITVTATENSDSTLTVIYGDISFSTSAQTGGEVLVSLNFPEVLPSNAVCFMVAENGEMDELDTAICSIASSSTIQATLKDGDAVTDKDGAENGVIVSKLAIATRSGSGSSSSSSSTSTSSGASGSSSSSGGGRTELSYIFLICLLWFVREKYKMKAKKNHF